MPVRPLSMRPLAFASMLLPLFWHPCHAGLSDCPEVCTGDMCCDTNVRICVNTTDAGSTKNPFNGQQTCNPDSPSSVVVAVIVGISGCAGIVGLMRICFMKVTAARGDEYTAASEFDDESSD
eukprot:TRINITY_DN50245_c0_g1_i1.p1 TRINITY_DN50245_c0_g1~~TRINITY_DN50245_c0_g1_i1.p1  ORF type:complete len:122 (-),score=3.00 TRINITY_DN50245_c0_g1_i1:169-534(-)